MEEEGLLEEGLLEEGWDETGEGRWERDQGLWRQGKRTRRSLERT